MLTIRKSNTRGAMKIDWLDTKHSFSFGNYYNPQFMGFGTLRVINEDIIAPGSGFGTHPHKNMEIITFVTEGALEHKDSLGTGSVIVPGDLQRMSAGTGITHSEFNHYKDRPAKLLQIWILPEKEGEKPSYEQKNFSEKRKKGGLTLLASSDGKQDSITVHQDIAIYALDLKAGQQYHYNATANHKLWVQVVSGSLTLNTQELDMGDGVAIEKETTLTFIANETVEILLFDMND